MNIDHIRTVEALIASISNDSTVHGDILSRETILHADEVRVMLYTAKKEQANGKEKREPPTA